jgi:hypothetical protein
MEKLFSRFDKKKFFFILETSGKTALRENYFFASFNVSSSSDSKDEF